ncbi:unnamed protein product [Amoebophrya sp. A120]|nr:unnamed protein product [Amoebophrya sp. A120]|eukprot:GSA120T00000782001.1
MVDTADTLSRLQSAASSTYGTWVKRRAEDYYLKLQRNIEDEAASSTNLLNRELRTLDPVQIEIAADILSRNASLTQETELIVKETLFVHSSCVAAAKKGHLCCKVNVGALNATCAGAIAGHGTAVMIWVPPTKNRIPVPRLNDPNLAQVRAEDFLEDQDGGAAAGPNLQDAPNPGPAIRDQVRNNNGAAPAPIANPNQLWPTMMYDGRALEVWVRERSRLDTYPKADAKELSAVFQPLADSVAQEQTRAWMAAVRRGAAKRMLGEGEQSGRRSNLPDGVFRLPVPLAHLPSELFMQIKSFLRDPVTSVLLNPSYLARLAHERRLQDLEQTLDAALARYLQELQQTSARLLPGYENKVRGKLVVSEQEFQVPLPVPDDLSLYTLSVQLGRNTFSFEGPNVWPCRLEMRLITSRAWQDNWIHDAQLLRHPLVRPPPEERYDNIMSVLAVYFHGKGFGFKQHRRDRSTFSIWWKERK